jgi:hypothetical protein
MHIKIFTFTRPTTDIPFFKRLSNVSLFYTTMHVEGKILLEKRSYSEDLLVYTRETHWKSKEVYDAANEDEIMIKFHEERDEYLRENNIVMTEVV